MHKSQMGGQKAKNTSLEWLGMEESEYAEALDGPEETLETCRI